MENTFPIDSFSSTQVPKAQRQRIRLEIPLGLARNASLPAIVIRGKLPGPTTLVVSGVHGDEFEGVAAIPKALQSIDPESMAGTVIGIPVCNVLAFDSQTRTSPFSVDSGNLARSFPGKHDGLPTERMAAALFDFTTRMLAEDDLFVDLHSAGTRYRYARLVGFRTIAGKALGPSEEASRHFGLEQPAFLWAISPTPGTFNSETAAAGIPTVAAESPGQGMCRREDVDFYAKGIQNLLRYKGILPGQPPARSEAVPVSPTVLYSPADGLFVSDVDVNETVSAGQKLGEIIGEYGNLIAEVYTPHSGVIAALRTFGTIYGGEYIAWIVTLK